jgi:uncharacterized protein (TIGR02246 family)
MPLNRRLAFLALAGLGLSACQPLSERLADSDRQAIQAAVDGFTKAVLANDFTTAASYYAEDGMMLPPNGPVVQGRSAISALLDGFPPITAFTNTIVELEANGDLAYARLTYAMTMTPPGAKVPLNDSGKVLIILRKQANGGWLTMRGMWNSDLTGRTVITGAATETRP